MKVLPPNDTKRVKLKIISFPFLIAMFIPFLIMGIVDSMQHEPAYDVSQYSWIGKTGWAICALISVYWILFYFIIPIILSIIRKKS